MGKYRSDPAAPPVRQRDPDQQSHDGRAAQRQQRSEYPCRHGLESAPRDGGGHAQPVEWSGGHGVLFQALLPVALFFFMYWLLGSWRWLHRPGWPRTMRWLGAAIVAAWMLSILRGGFV